MIPEKKPNIRIIERCDIRVLLDDPLNPNVMPPGVLDVLQRIIGAVGFLQPVLVRKARPDELTTEMFEAQATVAARRPIFYQPVEDGPTGCERPDFRGRDDGTPEKWCIHCGVNESAHDYYIIIDGHHRVKAARADGSVTHIPIVVLDVDADVASAIQIEMNKLHGDLDLAAVARNLGILVDVGWSTDDLTMTGFEPGEIDALLTKSDSGDPNDDVMNGPAGSSDEAEEKPPKPFVLTLEFANKTDLARAKRFLRKAAGGGRRPDMAKGLLAVVDGEEAEPSEEESE
jgi:hypothetical protein